jgi:hypothetical protein
MLCFLSSCNWRRRHIHGCSRSSSTWLYVYWNNCRIVGSGLDGIIWRCCSRGKPFCKFTISWSCWNILERNRLCIYIMYSIMRCTSLRKKKHDNINRLISLPNLNRALNLFFVGWGVHLRDEHSWNQYICFTTLRLLVSCIYFKYSFNRSIEEYIYYAIPIWPLYVVDIKGCHHEGCLLLLWVWPEGKQPLFEVCYINYHHMQWQ